MARSSKRFGVVGNDRAPSRFGVQGGHNEGVWRLVQLLRREQKSRRMAGSVGMSLV